METNIRVIGKIDLSPFEKKQKVVEVITYPQEEIHFFTGKGKKIVGRSLSGKIAVISFDFKGSWVKDGEDWLCDILSEETHKLIIRPVTRTVSSTENFQQSVIKLQTLKENGFHKPFLHPKNSILYCSSK